MNMEQIFEIIILFSIILSWGFVCVTSGYKFDAEAFLREIRAKNLRENVYYTGSLRISTKMDLWYKWVTRIAFLLFFIYWKIFFILMLDSTRNFSHHHLTTIIVTFIVILPFMFPYLYYGAFCKRIHKHYPKLVPESCKDDLKMIQGGIIIKYKWRVGLAIVALIAFVVQIILIF